MRLLGRVGAAINSTMGRVNVYHTCLADEARRPGRDYWEEDDRE